MKLLKLGIFMWKVLHDGVPAETLKNHFSIRQRCYCNDSLKFHLPIANKYLFKCDIVYQRSKLWNSIPPDIRSEKGFPSFKTILKDYLLYNQLIDVIFFSGWWVLFYLFSSHCSLCWLVYRQRSYIMYKWMYILYQNV